MLSIANVIIGSLIGVALWIKYRFGQVNIDQILSTLFMGGDGLFTADVTLFIEPIVIIFLSASTSFFIFKKFIKNKLSQYTFVFILLAVASLITKATIQTAPIANEKFNDVNILEKNFSNDINSKTSSENRTSSYIPVTLDIIKPPNSGKRNLILIYVESLETSYRNERLFGKNLLTDLDLIKGVEFANYEQIYGTGWTMGAIVATQCGVPLRPSQDVIKFFKHEGLNGNTLGEVKEVFMNGFVCLGDILKSNGYTNVFIGGASGSFSGKHKFFTGHGYEQTYGREEWMSLGEKSLNDWGLYDDRLFENAKLIINKLSERNTPFNLTILTVDTHHPAGFVSPRCNTIFPNANFENIVECTSILVSEFIRYVIAKYPNTDIVVLGDHLAMINPVSDKLDTLTKRTIYNKFIFKKKLEKNREYFHHYSILPTILYGMDFKFENGLLALGQTALNSQSNSIILKNVEETDQDSALINSLYKNAWSKKQ